MWSNAITNDHYLLDAAFIVDSWSHERRALRAIHSPVHRSQAPWSCAYVTLAASTAMATTIPVVIIPNSPIMIADALDFYKSDAIFPGLIKRLVSTPDSGGFTGR